MAIEVMAAVVTAVMTAVMAAVTAVTAARKSAENIVGMSASSLRKRSRGRVSSGPQRDAHCSSRRARCVWQAHKKCESWVRSRSARASGVVATSSMFSSKQRQVNILSVRGSCACASVDRSGMSWSLAGLRHKWVREQTGAHGARGRSTGHASMEQRGGGASTLPHRL